MARNLVGRVSLDQWEKEREKQKLVKANECLQARRKLSYDKAAKEALVNQMKLRNQLPLKSGLTISSWQRRKLPPT